jgi:hypothetical protein
LKQDLSVPKPRLAELCPKAISSKWKPVCVALGFYLFVGLLQVLVLYPLHKTMDIPIWDEAQYLGGGDIFLHGGNLGPLDTSPLYALIYAVLISAAGRIASIFCAQYLVKTFVSLALFCFLSAQLKSRLMALLLTTIWIVCGVNVYAGILVNFVALGLFLLALACIEGHRILALLLLCLCCLARLDYIFVFIPLACYLAWESLRIGVGRRSSAESVPKATGMRAWEYTLASLLAFVVVYVLFHVSAFGEGGQHAWFTFSQLYSWHEVETGRFQLNPYIDYNLVMKVDFPGATSLLQAFEVNPRAFTMHLARNVPITAKAALLILPLPYGGSLQIVMRGVIVGSFMTVILLASVSGKFAENLLIAFRKRKAIFYVTVMSLLPLIPVQLGYPIARYVLITVPFLLFWPGLVCQEALEATNSPRFGRRLLIALILLVVVSVVLSPKPYAVEDSGRHTLSEISELNQLWPNKRMKLAGIGSTWIADYLGNDKVEAIEPISALGRTESQDITGDMRTIIERYDPDVVLVNGELLGSQNFDGSSLSVLHSNNWRLCVIGTDSFYFKAGESDTHFPCFSN